jgi:non-ribosomal peptide synthetase component F
MDLVRDLRLDDALADHRRHLGDRPAVADGDNWLTYRELACRVDALSAALHAHGFGAGDRLVWLGGDSLRLIEYFLAAMRLGGVFCPVDARLPRPTLDAILADCAPALVARDGAAEARLPAYPDGAPVPEIVASDAPLLLLYTVLGDRAVGMQIPRATLLHEAVDAALGGRGDITAYGPLHQIAPLVSALAAILAGTTVVVSASPAAARTLLEL